MLPEAFVKRLHKGSYRAGAALSSFHHDDQRGLTTAPAARIQTRVRHYLEGLKLTFYLLGEVLAVLTKLALLGGLSPGILKLHFQL